MRALAPLAVGALLSATASAQVLATDDFSYTGSLTANGWAAHSGAGNKEIQSNGSFAILDFSPGSGEDVNLAFPPLTATDDVYASFTLNVPSGNPVNPDNNGSYFLHFKDAGFAFRGRFGLLSPAGTGDFGVGINASGSSLGGGGVWPSDLAFDTNYTVVVSYDAATGESKLWVDPTGPSSPSVSHTGTAGDLIESIALRQASDHTGFIHVDDIVVGGEFADVLDCSGGPLTTTFAGGQGQKGCMFDLRAGAAPVGIQGFDLNLTSHPQGGTWDIAVYTTINGGSHVGVEQDPSAWMLVSTASGVVSSGVNIPTPVTFSPALCVPVEAGQQRGFYVTVTNGLFFDMRNTDPGPGAQVGDVYAGNCDLDVLIGTSNAYPFLNVFSPRVFNGTVYYAVDAACGSVGTFGDACGSGASSFYERLTSPAFDLSGMKITATQTAAGYDVTTAPGSVTPIGGGAIALPLNGFDQLDTSTVGGTLGLHVGGNGWVATDGPNLFLQFTPNETRLLENTYKVIAAWSNLRTQTHSSGTGTGTIYYEENGSVATVTWDGVQAAFGPQDPNTFQISYDTASGDYSIAFGAISATNQEDWVVGYSDGFSVDPGSRDISAGGFSLPREDTLDLTLRSNVPGLAGTWVLDLANVQGPFTYYFFGDTGLYPGYDLTADGAPGCFVWTNANLGVWLLPSFGGASQMTIPIPNASALLGTEVTAQGAGLDSSNALGLNTSNGIFVKIGGCSYEESFEGLPNSTTLPDGWSQGGVRNWEVQSNGTPSGNTGPTSAFEGSNYIYCETSSPAVTGDTFIADSPAISALNAPTNTLTFQLSRIGATMGTLSVYMDDGAGTWNLLTSYSGPDPSQSQGGLEWSYEVVDLTKGGTLTVPAAIKLRFEYVKGSSFTGDLAIDSICLK